jgi:hypothetical protein
VVNPFRRQKPYEQAAADLQLSLVAAVEALRAERAPAPLMNFEVLERFARGEMVSMPEARRQVRLLLDLASKYGERS